MFLLLTYLFTCVTFVTCVTYVTHVMNVTYVTKFTISYKTNKINNKYVLYTCICGVDVVSATQMHVIFVIFLFSTGKTQT